jgi:nucleoside-diphosphate-sugar epimerase
MQSPWLAPQGGAGFIGSHATLRLLSDGHTVTIVVRVARAVPA